MEYMKTKKKSVISNNHFRGFMRRAMICSFATIIMISSNIVSVSAAENDNQTEAIEASTVTAQPVAADNSQTNKAELSSTDAQTTESTSSANVGIVAATTVFPVEVPAASNLISAVKVVTAPKYVYNLSEYDKSLLLKIGMAEAGNQGPDGIGLVMQTVMNRLYNDPGNKFPNSVHGIVYSPNQYTTNKSYIPNKDCYTALEYLMQGRYVAWSKGAIAFASLKGGKWHDRNLKHLFTYKGHKFYKFK